MGLISQLKCAFSSKQSLESNYKHLSSERLEQRKKSLLKIYLASTIGWSSALIITILSASMSTPILILYTGVIITLLFTTYMDYRSKKNKIDKILNGRKRE